MPFEVTSNIDRQIQKQGFLIPRLMTSEDVSNHPVVVLAISPGIPTGYSQLMFNTKSELYEIVDYGRVLVPGTVSIIEFLSMVGICRLNRHFMLAIGDVLCGKAIPMTQTTREIMMTRDRWITCAEVLTRSHHAQDNVLISAVPVGEVNSRSQCNSEKGMRTPMHKVFVAKTFPEAQVTPEEATAICVAMAQVDLLGAGVSTTQYPKMGRKFFGCEV